MEADLWRSCAAAAKRQYTNQFHQNYQLDRQSIDDCNLEEEVRADFPCPYCYEDHDLSSLCAHLEDEHPFETKVTVCPVCSVKISRNMLNHITRQHGHLFKLQRRQKLRRVATPSNHALSLLGRDLREAHLQVLLGGGGYKPSSNIVANPLSDPFLSSLMFNFTTSEMEGISHPVVSCVEDNSEEGVTFIRRKKLSLDDSLSMEERDQKAQQAMIQAEFMQDLLLSTMFGA